MLTDLLSSKKCIKLVCGAGNEDIEYIRKLVTIYAHAGIRYFDVAANPLAVRTVHEVMNELRMKADVCVSYGIKGDPHADKAILIEDECIGCRACIAACPQKCIVPNSSIVQIDMKQCIGCGQCAPVCPRDALVMTHQKRSIDETLPDIIKEGISTVELHISSGYHDEIMSDWHSLNSLFDGLLSICIDRSHHSDNLLKLRLEEMLKVRKPYTTTIQADGVPMSGNDDNPSTTLQALATTQIVNRLKLPVYVLISGGTNNHTAKYAELFDLQYNGISLGSYERKLVEPYIDECLNDRRILWEGIHKARNIVETALTFMEGF